MSPPEVFLVGSTGYLGSALVPTLESHANRKEILLKLGVRSTSNKPINTHCEVVTLDFDNVEQLASKFKGSDVIISVLRLKPDNIFIHNNIALAASKARVKAYIPSQFSLDFRVTKYNHIMFDLKTNHKSYAQALGLKVISIYNSAFLELSLSALLNIKDGNSEWNIVGKSSDPLSLISLVDLGHILVRIAIIVNEDPEKIPSDFRVCSDTHSYDDYASIVKKTFGRDIKINAESIFSAEKRYNDGISDPNDEFFTTLKLISSEHALDFSKDNLNNFINPNEKYFKWTKFDDYVEAVNT